MASFYRNGTYVSDYTRSDGTYVSGHYRDGSYVNFDEHCRYYDPYVSETQNLFLTHCFDCGQEVYFVRNTTYSGCFLADQIEPNWVIHPCWEEKLFDQAKMETILQYYQRESARIRNAEIKSERDKQEKAQKEEREKVEREKRLRQAISTRPLAEVPKKLDTVYVTGMVFGHISCGPNGGIKLYIAEAYDDTNRFKLYIHPMDLFDLKLFEENRVQISKVKRGVATLLFLKSQRFNLQSAIKSTWVRNPGLVPRHLLAS